MKCLLCGKPITLVPSASERAKKYGQTPGFYNSLFTTHSDCQVASWYGRETEDMRNHRVKLAKEKT